MLRWEYESLEVEGLVPGSLYDLHPSGFSQEKGEIWRCSTESPLQVLTREEKTDAALSAQILFPIAFMGWKS